MQEGTLRTVQKGGGLTLFEEEGQAQGAQSGLVRQALILVSGAGVNGVIPCKKAAVLSGLSSAIGLP